MTNDNHTIDPFHGDALPEADANWQPIETAPMNTPVETMILDGSGQRNETLLVQRRRDPSCRALWFVPDGSMYVYYTPTHWRTPVSGAGE